MDDRRNFKLLIYFQRFSLKARQSIQHVVMDMNASYASVIPRVFPNAKILIDHFHVIQQISCAFNQQRIRTQKRLDKNNSQEGKDYRKLKKYWKQLLKKRKKLGYEQLKQFPLFRRKYVTESEVVDYLLTIDPVLKASYEIYQDLLDAFEKREATEFFSIIDHLSNLLEKPFVHSLHYLKSIENQLYYLSLSPTQTEN